MPKVGARFKKHWRIHIYFGKLHSNIYAKGKSILKVCLAMLSSSKNKGIKT